VATGGLGSEAQALTWAAFLGRNLLPVTIGNIIGGSVLVGAVYWFAYLRPRGPAR
jgi:formate/nitrite transporter FocA (FNT family)